MTNAQPLPHDPRDRAPADTRNGERRPDDMKNARPAPGGGAPLDDPSDLDEPENDRGPPERRDDRPYERPSHGGHGRFDDRPGGRFDDRQRGEDRSNDRATGVLFVAKDGYGFLRQPKQNYMPGQNDVYVPKNVIQRWRIRPGSEVEGYLGRGKRGKKKRPLEVVTTINGRPPEEHVRTPQFKDVTSIDPDRRIKLEITANDPSLRVVDLVAPIGFGQRALIVAPPRTGKTMLLQKMANAVGENHPNAKTIVLLVDERPEEVTDFRRNCKHAEVVASSLDQDASDHVMVCEMVLERTRRLVEAGQDVVCLIDSLTRMARAYNTERGRSGRTLSGGLDSQAMQKPREIFGAARCSELGGSLTMIATALIDTGSKMDQVIFEEFKGTGNMELVLSRDLADRRIFPAIDVKSSGTRKEEKLRDTEELRLVTVLRRGLLRFQPIKAMESLIERLKQTQTNAEFLMQVAKGAPAGS